MFFDKTKLSFFLILFFTFSLIIVFSHMKLSLNNIFKSIIFSQEAFFNEEWESIKNRQFFKKNSLFYFSDLNLLVINFISLKPSSTFILQIFLKSSNNEFNRTYETSRIQRVTKVMSAEFNVLMLNLDSESVKFLSNNLNTNFSLKIIDNKLNSDIQNSINVKIKKFNNNSKKNSIICSKCLYNYSNKRSESLKWWIELNKRLGYQKISLCNYSIENSDIYTNLFKKYSNFVELTQLKFVPDLDQNENGPPKFIHNLNFTQRKFHIYFDLLAEFMINECYYNNLEKYKFITAVDADETIIPKSSRFPSQKSVFDFITNADKISYETIFEALNCKNESLQIENYLDKLSSKYSIAKGKSIYFLQGLLISYEKMERIFESVRNKLNKEGMKLPISVHLKFDNESEIMVDVDKTNFEYAKKLLEFDQKVLGPFWKKNEKYLGNFNFAKFYYLSGAHINFLYGKTIHNTDQSFRVQTHQSIWQIYSGKMRKKIDQTSVKLDDGFDSHFRSKFPSRIKKISFSEIHLDIFYLNCFLIPIFKSF